jgi:hypothetical protein
MNNTQLTQLRVDRAMTVGEMIEELKNFDENDKVVIGYDFGNRSGTQVREAVKYVEDQSVEWSDYHKMLKEVPEDSNEIEQAVRVVVIS